MHKNCNDVKKFGDSLKPRKISTDPVNIRNKETRKEAGPRKPEKESRNSQKKEGSAKFIKLQIKTTHMLSEFKDPKSIKSFLILFSTSSSRILKSFKILKDKITFL